MASRPSPPPHLPVTHRAVGLTDLIGLTNNLNEPMPPANRAAVTLGLMIPAILISALLGLVRLYTRFFISRKPGWDDAFLIAYLVSTTMGSSFFCTMRDYGYGKHVVTLPLAMIQEYFFRIYIVIGSYTLSTSFIKLSLLFQYLRILGKGRLATFCQLLILITIIWGLVFCIMAWIPCIPVRAFWVMPRLSECTCWAFGSPSPTLFAATYVSHAAINMMLDLAVLYVAVVLYLRSGTPMRSRIGLLMLLLLGSVASFLSVWRLANIVETRATTWPTFDPTWYAPTCLLMAALEVHLASICASVPVFWPVLQERLAKIFVTREIEITYENRSDEFELHRTASGTGSNADDRATDPLSTVDRDGQKPLRGLSLPPHYSSGYVREYVDPLHPIKMARTAMVETLPAGHAA